MNGKDVEAAEQVLAQLAARHGPQRVAVGRGDEPHVGLQHLRRADAHERAALEGTQELDLQVASGISVISSRKSVPPLVRPKRSPAGPKAWSRARARLATASGSSA